MEEKVTVEELPIKVIVKVDDFSKQADEQMADMIIDSVMDSIKILDIDVNKAELIKALKYDRKQYDKGYNDGLADAVRHAHWEYTDTGKPYCSYCAALGEDVEYCGHCGAKMDEEEQNEID